MVQGQIVDMVFNTIVEKTPEYVIYFGAFCMIIYYNSSGISQPSACSSSFSASAIYCLAIIGSVLAIL